jgi:DNA polymerase-3 subunit gamma/tau
MNEISENQDYRVLARKYRPTTFSGLIGQDAMVRTLTNAIGANRLPHAFILIGVRGIGKTSTARIIARALNCISTDGNGGPTAEPCGECIHCKSIENDSHVDVIEMDAASRTGVNDIRELIEGVRYRPVEARYKIYIIDEVHMLSTSAFNALLKTLEEPPEHVKFIFATTETRKVPVTVLSRCQRFDLRRVETEVLCRHFGEVAKKEGVTVSEETLAMIARAADGSVRDGLSLLDQAIAHSGIEHEGSVSEENVRDMLGLADNGRLYDLFENLLAGKAQETLMDLGGLYAAGADPQVILEDLLNITHWLTRLSLDPSASEGQGVSELDRERGSELANRVNIQSLGRIWQILLKGLEDLRNAPSAIQAAEMVLIRLIHMSELPSPSDLLRMVQEGQKPGQNERVSNQVKSTDSAPAPTVGAGLTSGPRGTVALASGGPRNLPEPALDARPVNQMPRTFEEVIALFEEKREGLIAASLRGQIHLVSFEAGHICFRADEEAPSDLANRVSRLLKEWTGQQWLVSLSEEVGHPTIRETREAVAREKRNSAIAHPLVQAALEAFPDARVESVTQRADLLDGELEFYSDPEDDDDRED